MKYSEFIKIASDRDFKVFNIKDDVRFITAIYFGENENLKCEIGINRDFTDSMYVNFDNTNCKEKILDVDVLQAGIELAKTPIEERE